MRSLDWSPDGRTLVTSGNDSDGDQGGEAVFLIDIETGAARKLTNPAGSSDSSDLAYGFAADRGPRFSPDGSHVAFLRVVTESRHDVMITSTSGPPGSARALSHDAWGQVRGVEWTRDGGSVLFSSNRIGRFTLWRVALAGGDPERVPIQDDWVTQPSVANNANRLIYRTFRDSVDLWELPLDADGQVAGEPSRRMGSTRSERQPVWSADGARIAFLSDRTGSLELWSGAPNGDQLLRHTELNGPLPGSPAWSPDGTQLVFDAAVHGHSDLWSVAADSRRPMRLTTDASEERNPTFSRNGQSIYFGSNRSGDWEVWRMPAAGGVAERVTSGGGFLAHESASSSSSSSSSSQGRDSLFYVKLDEPGIWRMPLAGDGGPPELVLAGPGIADWGSWVVDDRGLWFVTHNPTTISFLDFESDAAEPRVVYTPSKQVPYFGRVISLSSDGRALLFSMIDHSDDEIMRVELEGI